MQLAPRQLEKARESANITGTAPTVAVTLLGTQAGVPGREGETAAHKEGTIFSFYTD